MRARWARRRLRFPHERAHLATRPLLSAPNPGRQDALTRKVTDAGLFARPSLCHSGQRLQPTPSRRQPPSPSTQPHKRCSPNIHIKSGQGEGGETTQLIHSGPHPCHQFPRPKIIEVRWEVTTPACPIHGGARTYPNESRTAHATELRDIQRVQSRHLQADSRNRRRAKPSPPPMKE